MENTLIVKKNQDLNVKKKMQIVYAEAGFAFGCKYSIPLISRYLKTSYNNTDIKIMLCYILR